MGDPDPEEETSVPCPVCVGKGRVPVSVAAAVKSTLAKADDEDRFVQIKDVVKIKKR
jgi:hypothetical protein